MTYERSLPTPTHGAGCESTVHLQNEAISSAVNNQGTNIFLTLIYDVRLQLLNRPLHSFTNRPIHHTRDKELQAT